MSDLWTEASRDFVAEHEDGLYAVAARSVADVLPWVAAASSPTEFSHRLALRGDKLDFKAQVIADTTPYSFIEARLAMEQFLTEGYETLRASAKTAGINWQTESLLPGEWFVNPSGFVYGKWATISDEGGVFTLTVWNADGGEYDADTQFSRSEHATLEEAQAAAEYLRSDLMADRNADAMFADLSGRHGPERATEMMREHHWNTARKNAALPELPTPLSPSENNTPAPADAMANGPAPQVTPESSKPRTMPSGGAPAPVDGGITEDLAKQTPSVLAGAVVASSFDPLSDDNWRLPNDDDRFCDLCGGSGWRWVEDGLYERCCESTVDRPDPYPGSPPPSFDGDYNSTTMERSRYAKTAVADGGYYVIGSFGGKIAGPFATVSEARAAAASVTNSSVQFLTPDGQVRGKGDADPFLFPMGYLDAGRPAPAFREMMSNGGNPWPDVRGETRVRSVESSDQRGKTWRDRVENSQCAKCGTDIMSPSEAGANPSGYCSDCAEARSRVAGLGTHPEGWYVIQRGTFVSGPGPFGSKEEAAQRAQEMNAEYGVNDYLPTWQGALSFETVDWGDGDGPQTRVRTDRPCRMCGVDVSPSEQQSQGEYCARCARSRVASIEAEIRKTNPGLPESTVKRVAAKTAERYLNTQDGFNLDPLDPPSCPECDGPARFSWRDTEIGSDPSKYCELTCEACGYQFHNPTCQDPEHVGKTASQKTAMPNPKDLGIAVGDIFYNDWGYDQTNIDFYEVVRLTPAGVEVVPISKRRVEENGPGGNRVVAVPGRRRERDIFIGPGKVCRVRDGWDNRPYIVLNRDHIAFPWNGEPLYETDSMFGR